MNEDKIKKIILFFVIIFLIYLILRYVNSMKMYSYPMAMSMSTTSNVVYDKRNGHYYMPQAMPRYNAYKAQYYN